ncbi:YvaD family protein [Nonomuraea helvata]
MLPVTKRLMLVTDLGFVAYFTITGLGIIPPEWTFADYANPLMADWNWSFLWIDLLASATGLASLWVFRSDQLMLVSLVLTMASGLMAIAFWTLRGDYSLLWWAPNLYLMLFPVPAIVRLIRQGRSPRSGRTPSPS